MYYDSALAGEAGELWNKIAHSDGRLVNVAYQMTGGLPDSITIIETNGEYSYYGFNVMIINRHEFKLTIAPLSKCLKIDTVHVATWFFQYVNYYLVRTTYAVGQVIGFTLVSSNLLSPAQSMDGETITKFSMKNFNVIKGILIMFFYSALTTMYSKIDQLSSLRFLSRGFYEHIHDKSSYWIEHPIRNNIRHTGKKLSMSS